MRRRAEILYCLASGCPALSWQVWDALTGCCAPISMNAHSRVRCQLPPCLFPLNRDPGLELTALFQLLSSCLTLCVWPVLLSARWRCCVRPSGSVTRLTFTALTSSSSHPPSSCLGFSGLPSRHPPALPWAEITPTPWLWTERLLSGARAQGGLERQTRTPALKELTVWSGRRGCCYC